MSRYTAALLLLAALLIGGCAPIMTPTDQTPSPGPAASQSPEPTPGASATPEPASTPHPTPGPAAPTPGRGGTPAPNAAVQAAADFVAGQLGLNVSQISVEQYEAVDWPDACLGAAGPDEMCAQVITPGYRVVFNTPNGSVEVRTDRTGRVVRLSQPGGGNTPQSGTAGPLPTAVTAARQALAEQLGVSGPQAQVKDYREVQWRDSCLGAAAPGEMCLQVITPGYRVIFSTPQGEYEVHTDRTGRAARVVRPDGGGPLSAGTPAADRPGISWLRTGGIAGVCQQLSVTPDGKYRSINCKTQETLAAGQLSVADFNRVSDWLNRFVPFDWQAPLPAGAADMFNDSYHFVGVGAQQPTAAEQQTIAEFLSTLSQKR